MTEETNEFIENWELKLSQIQGNNLSNIYDRFMTLFTIYNRLYNETYGELEAYNRLTKNRYTDFEKATDIVVDFLGAKNILDRIEENNNIKQIDSVINLLENKVFNINLKNGQPKEETDKQLLENLKNRNVEIRAKAVTSIIYNVRCNIVHGHKDFQEYQRLIVDPLTKLLTDINQEFKIKLS